MICSTRKVTSADEGNVWFTHLLLNYFAQIHYTHVLKHITKHNCMIILWFSCPHFPKPMNCATLYTTELYSKLGKSVENYYGAKYIWIRYVEVEWRRPRMREMCLITAICCFNWHLFNFSRQVWISTRAMQFFLQIQNWIGRNLIKLHPNYGLKIKKNLALCNY